MVDIIPARAGATGRLDPDQKRAFVVPGLGDFGSRYTASHNLRYHPVPYNYTHLPNPPMWRLDFKFGPPAPQIAVGMDIYGDIVLGRGSQGLNSPDVDLTQLSALDLGVSRRHALIRPTKTQLFIIDLESTNGTFVNAIPVGRGMAQVIRTGDTVALAGLKFVVEIVASPGADSAEIVTKPLNPTPHPSPADEDGDAHQTLQLDLKRQAPRESRMSGGLPPVHPADDDKD